MICAGEVIYYIEYLDHGLVQDLEEVLENKLVLWCCGKIMKESEEYIAVVSSGTKDRLPSSNPQYEIIYKPAIIKKEVIKTI